jgi:acyl-coenzyme A thioesterase PaaI-like protein
LKSSSRQGFLPKVRLAAGLLRFGMNLWPPFIGAGIHVLQIAPDFRHVRVRLRLGILNRNYFGTHYGGSLYSMTDPFFALMMLHNLGPGYTVWDRAASIRFVAPGRSTVYADFRLDEAQIETARRRATDGARYEPVYTVDIVDPTGAVVACVEKTLYIRGPAAAG